MRLPEETPARRSLKESLSEIKKKVGRPKLTWIKVIEKDLTSININLNVNTEPPDEIIKKLIELTEEMAVNC